MKVCLDPGHSYGLNGKGSDPGAINSELGIKESVIAMEIVRDIKKKLEEYGIETILTRTSGRDDLTLKKRCDIANDNKVDFFVSIHLNSADNANAHGIETLIHPLCSPKARDLANNIQKNLIMSTEARDRGIKERPDLYVLKHTKMPAVLVEVGFISNKEEGLKLNDHSYQLVLATAISNAIYFMAIPF